MHPKTTGGPKPAEPSVGEQLVLDNLEGRPSMCGLQDGIDTAGIYNVAIWEMQNIHVSS